MSDFCCYLAGTCQYLRAWKSCSLRKGAAYSPKCVERLSEKSRRCPWCNSTDRREGLFRPISVFSLRPNQTSERCSDPFSDSLSRARLYPFGKEEGVGYDHRQSA